MEDIKLTILGRGSALPTRQSNQSCQILDINGKLMMIDCGEGAQIWLRHMNLKISRLNHIFISHLHGDHCLGLMGLLSSFSMMGRKATLVVHSHSDLIGMMKTQIEFFGGLGFDVQFEPFDPFHAQVVYEDKKIEAIAFPMKHSIAASGFVFREKKKQRHIRANQIEKYNIGIADRMAIKNGADFKTQDGKVIPNKELTLAPDPCRKYAYCSDTTYYEKIIPYIEGADCLYHEATFLDEDKARAKKTGHSTAKMAAEMAKNAHVKKLIIGHFSARYDNYEPLLEEAKAIFPNTVVAEEKKTYLI